MNSGVKHNRFIPADENLVLEMKSDRVSKNLPLHVSAFALQVSDAVAVTDAGDLLLDDGAVIELLGDVVSGGSDDLHTSGSGLLVRIGAGEGGQEGVMDVNAASVPRLGKGGRENLHVAGEHHQIDLVLF